MNALKQRQSNIELLRTIAMLMIVGHHLAVHSGFYFSGSRMTANMLFLQWLNVGGKVGVDLFILISGYFLVTSPGIRVRKVVKLWLQIFFWSVVIFSFACLTGLTEFSGWELVRALSPIVSRQWWFASSYFLLYLLSPALNRLLAKLTGKGPLLLLAVLAALWYVIPVLTWLPEWLRDLAWFVFLYCIAGCMRLRGIAGKRKAGTWLALGTGLLLASFGWAVFLLGFSLGQDRYETAYFQTWHPLLLLSSIAIFLGFLRLELKRSPLIDSAAAAAFGIYLIHDSNYLRYPLWQGLLQCSAWRDAAGLIVWSIAAIIGVWLVCLALERARIALLDGPFSAVSDRAEARFQKHSPDNS